MPSNPSVGRPELIATLLRIDLRDAPYNELAAAARSVGGLLSDTAVQRDPNVVAAMDDLLGALYCLILARHHGFQDRVDRPIELDVLTARAEQLERGDVRIDGTWIAGWHFNGALLRLAAVYHRLLKIVLGEPSTTAHVPELLRRLAASSHSGWSHSHLDAVHAEVNSLKHSPPGVHDRRTAILFDDALQGIKELFELVRVWRDGDNPRATQGT